MLLAERAAEIVLDRLQSSSQAIDHELASTVAHERGQVTHHTDKVIIYLFTTLCLIAIVFFSYGQDSVKAFGFEFTERVVFIFSALLIGNVLYVVHTGLFFKAIMLEYLLLKILQHPTFQGSRELNATLLFYPANIFTVLTHFHIIYHRTNAEKLFMSCVNLYTKYIIIVLYGAFYYTVLLAFLYEVWNTDQIFVFSVLIFANVMSSFTSLAIFYHIPRTYMHSPKFY